MSSCDFNFNKEPLGERGGNRLDKDDKEKEEEGEKEDCVIPGTLTSRRARLV